MAQKKSVANLFQAQFQSEEDAALESKTEISETIAVDEDKSEKNTNNQGNERKSSKAAAAPRKSVADLFAAELMKESIDNADHEEPKSEVVSSKNDQPVAKSEQEDNKEKKDNVEEKESDDNEDRKPPITGTKRDSMSKPFEVQINDDKNHKEESKSEEVSSNVMSSTAKSENEKDNVNKNDNVDSKRIDENKHSEDKKQPSDGEKLRRRLTFTATTIKESADKTVKDESMSIDGLFENQAATKQSEEKINGVANNESKSRDVVWQNSSGTKEREQDKDSKKDNADKDSKGEGKKQLSKNAERPLNSATTIKDGTDIIINDESKSEDDQLKNQSTTKECEDKKDNVDQKTIDENKESEDKKPLCNGDGPPRSVEGQMGKESTQNQVNQVKSNDVLSKDKSSTRAKSKEKKNRKEDKGKKDKKDKKDQKNKKEEKDREKKDKKSKKQREDDNAV